MNVVYPQNFKDFLKIFAAGRLDFIPDILEAINESHMLESPKNFYEHEFSGFFLHSGGTMVLLWVFFVLVYLVSKLAVLFARKKNSVLNQFFRRSVEQFEWSGMIRMWTSTYLELLFAGLLQIRVINFSDGFYILSSVFAIGFTLANFALPFLSLTLIKKKIKGSSNNLNKYRALVDDYDTERKSSKYFLFFVLCRRMFMIISVLFLYYHPKPQVILPWIFNLCLLVLLVVVKPHNSSLLNFSESFTELGFFIIHSLIIMFAFVEDIQEDRRE